MPISQHVISDFGFPLAKRKLRRRYHTKIDGTVTCYGDGVSGAAVFTLAGDQWIGLRGLGQSKWRVLDVSDQSDW